MFDSKLYKRSLLALMFASLAPLAMANDKQVVETISAPDLKALVQAEGFSDVTFDSDGELIVKMNGYRVLIIPRENKNTAIKFRFSIQHKAATLEAMNRWNSKKKFTDAYLDSDGDPSLDMDVDLAGGVTRARIKDAIRTFSLSQAAFVAELMKL